MRYYDKSRMEINNPGGDQSSIYYVTNGLLTEELVTGRMQMGDSEFDQHAPSTQLVAGDPSANPGTPQLRRLCALCHDRRRDESRRRRTPAQAVTAYLNGAGV